MTVAAQQAPVKERTRGPNLAVLANRPPGLPMEEGLRRADGAGRVVVSNKMMSEELAVADDRLMPAIFPCWTGTMVAYDEPGKKLESTIEYLDSKTWIRYVFPVPEEHIGKMNIALVAEHPDFALETEGKTRRVQAKKVGVVADFPVATQKWYPGDAQYDIPTGSEVDPSMNNAARCLERIDKLVGLVVRHHMSWGEDLRWYVSLNRAPSDALGVAVEAP